MPAAGHPEAGQRVGGPKRGRFPLRLQEAPELPHGAGEGCGHGGPRLGERGGDRRAGPRGADQFGERHVGGVGACGPAVGGGHASTRDADRGRGRRRVHLSLNVPFREVKSDSQKARTYSVGSRSHPRAVLAARVWSGTGCCEIHTGNGSSSRITRRNRYAAGQPHRDTEGEPIAGA